MMVEEDDNKTEKQDKKKLANFLQRIFNSIGRPLLSPFRGREINKTRSCTSQNMTKVHSRKEMMEEDGDDITETAC